MKHENKPVVLLVYGGESPEHDVSIASARNVYDALDKQAYQIMLCYIDTLGRWWHCKDFDLSDKQQLAPALGKKAVILGGKSLTVDVIFPVLHGEGGEDGTIQGLARLMHVPIVGCDVAGSSVCIDKVLTKQLLAYNHIPIVPFVVAMQGQAELRYEEVAAHLGSTLFVKPARLGSSVGVSKVTDAASFADALAMAFSYDKKVLIEKAVTARELEVAVLGHNQQPVASVVGEIIPDREFYSYDSKYDDAATSQIKIPADISVETSKQIRDYARKAFTALECEGLSRIDFFLDESGALYLNEINTLPGFTNISMYPQLWQHAGMTYSALLTQLIELARKKT